MSVQSPYIPCIESIASCNLDWVGIAAVGGVLSAVATFVAVVVALLTASRQLRAAKEAVLADRETALLIQAAEWKARAAVDSQTAMRLALAFARELAYARRSLIATLLDWDPLYFAKGPQHIWESFVVDSPFNDLTLIRSCMNRLGGFKDEDAFRILTVLTTWQFFNSNPGLSLIDIIGRSEAERIRTATSRVKFGLDLLDLIDETVNSLHDYYGQHSSIRSDTQSVVPERLEGGLADLRKRMQLA